MHGRPPVVSHGMPQHRLRCRCASRGASGIHARRAAARRQLTAVCCCADGQLLCGAGLPDEQVAFRRRVQGAALPPRCAALSHLLCHRHGKDTLHAAVTRCHAWLRISWQPGSRWTYWAVATPTLEPPPAHQVCMHSLAFMGLPVAAKTHSWQCITAPPVPQHMDRVCLSSCSAVEGKAVSQPR